MYKIDLSNDYTQEVKQKVKKQLSSLKKRENYIRKL